MFMESPCIRLRAWRKRKELTLEQLAERLDCACHWTALSHIERDTRSPGRHMANAIERATGGEVRSTDWDDWEVEKKSRPTGGEAA